MPFPPLRFHGASSVLRHHPPPCRLPSISFPYTKALLSSSQGWVGEGFPSSVPFCLTMSSLTPRRSHRPSVRSGPRSVARHNDADFVHEIGTRPPQALLFTRLSVRSLVLRPGLLRSTLSGYIVESLSVLPFPDAHRLLATWLQSFTTLGTWGRVPFPAPK